MSIINYKAFLKTIELGSLTKAGEVLGYSQPGITHLINTLESDLGVKLLIRNHTGIFLTAAGEELLPYIKSICEDEDKLNNKISEINSSNSGIVRIGSFMSVSSYLLPPIVSAFSKEYPGIKLQFVSGSYDEIDSFVHKGIVDFGFTITPVAYESTTIDFYKDQVYVILPKGHPLEEYDAIPHEKLLDYPRILYSDNRSDRDWNNILYKEEIKKTSKHQINDDNATLTMVEYGLGITLKSELFLSNLSEKLVKKPLFPPAYRNIVISVNNTNKLSPSAKLFLDFLIKSKNQ